MFSGFSFVSVTLGGMRVLVVDDEPSVRQALDRALRFEGYQTEAAEDGPAALGAHAERPADAIVLDVAMPRMDGLEVAAGCAEQATTRRCSCSRPVPPSTTEWPDSTPAPTTISSSRSPWKNCSPGSGPCCAAACSTGDDEVLRFGDLSLDPGTREVRRGDRSMELTRTEFLLLELLLRNARQVLPRELIFDRVWGYDFGANSNSLEVYIGYLRRKTEAGGEPRLIHTVRGVGYVLREPAGPDVS